VLNAMSNERNSKLLITFAVFFLLFNFPILGIVDRQRVWFGLPATYLYLFLVWLLLIIVVAVIVSPNQKK